MKDFGEALTKFEQAYEEMERQLDALVKEPGISTADRDARCRAWVIIRGTLTPAMKELIELADAMQANAEALAAAEAYAKSQKGPS